MTSRTLAILAAIVLAILVGVLLWLAFEPEGPDRDAGDQPSTPTEAQAPATGSDDSVASDGEGVGREDEREPRDEPQVEVAPESEETKPDPERLRDSDAVDVDAESKQDDPDRAPIPDLSDGEAEDSPAASQPPEAPQVVVVPASEQAESEPERRRDPDAEDVDARPKQDDPDRAPIPDLSDGEAEDSPAASQPPEAPQVVIVPESEEAESEPGRRPDPDAEDVDARPKQDDPDRAPISGPVDGEEEETPAASQTSVAPLEVDDQDPEAAVPALGERVDGEDATQPVGEAVQCEETDPAPGCVEIPVPVDEDPGQDIPAAPEPPAPEDGEGREQPLETPADEDTPDSGDAEPTPGRTPVPDAVDGDTALRQEDPTLPPISHPVSGEGDEQEVRGVRLRPEVSPDVDIPEPEAALPTQGSTPSREEVDTELRDPPNPLVLAPGASVDEPEAGQLPEAQAAEGTTESGESAPASVHMPVPGAVDAAAVQKPENPSRLFLPRRASGGADAEVVRVAPRAAAPAVEGFTGAVSAEHALATGPEPVAADIVRMPGNEGVAVLMIPDRVDATEAGETSRLHSALPDADTPQPAPMAPSLRVPGYGRDEGAAESSGQSGLTPIVAPGPGSSQSVPDPADTGREPVSVGSSSRLGDVELPAEPDESVFPPSGAEAQQTEPLGRQVLGVLADWLGELLAAGTPGRGGPATDDTLAESDRPASPVQPGTVVVAEAGREMRQEPGIGAGELLASEGAGTSGDRLASPGAVNLDQSVAAVAVQELAVPGSGAGESTEVLPGAFVEPEPPSFDVVRSDAQGGTVVAGRAPAHSRVEVLANGEVVADVRASDRGEWVTILDGFALPAESVLTLRATTPEGRVLLGPARVALLRPVTSTSSVVVELDEDGGARQLPSAARDDADISIESLSYSEQDDVEISGRAIAQLPVEVSIGATGAEALGEAADPLTVHASEDGRWTAVVPGHLLKPGTVYRIRAVATLADGSVVEASTPFKRNRVRFAFQEGAVVVQPGNNLWVISRHVYGRGIRYHWIFQANSDQIDDPDLIYPGQVFIVPEDGPEVP